MNMPTAPLPSSDQLTLDQVTNAMPRHLQGMVTQGLVDQLNNIANDPIFAEQVRNNFVSYTSVMRDGKFKVEDYLHAVTYVSYKLMGLTNHEAYAKTFPDRYATLVAKNTPSKDIAAYVAAYNKGKLVNLIFEQTAVPLWVLNQHTIQRAISVQVELMETAASEKVRCEAANSILTHLKKPEGKDFQVSLDVKDASGIDDLKKAMRELAKGQAEILGQGASLKQIAGSPLIEGKVVRDADAD